MKTLDIEKLHLDTGSHDNAEEGMCVMEAVSFIAGEPFSDSPECASPVIAAFLRSYNDGLPDHQRQALKAWIPRLIGTKGSEAVEERRALISADWLVRTHTPAWLRLAGLTVHADALASLPEITSMAQIPSIKGPIEAARESSAAARDAASASASASASAAAWAAARDAAWAAAWDAAWAAARDAAWDAASAAAWDAAWAAAWAAASAAAWDATWDAAWAAAWAAARAAAWDAARAKLKPTVDELQATVPALIERMLAVTEETIAAEKAGQ